MSLKSTACRLAGRLLTFFLPWACAGCRTPLETIEDSGFCGMCWLTIARIDGLICRCCGIPLKDGGNLCFNCHQRLPRVMVRAAVVYAGPIVNAVHRFKYANRKTLSNAFGSLMFAAWERYRELQPIDVLIPIPLHSSSLRERGYNQAAVLAETLAGNTSSVMLNNVLVRTRKTKPQFGLQKLERLTNVNEAFGVAPGITRHALKGCHVLLIDDVCTTAATIKESARMLRQAGARSIKALVLARDV